MKKGFSYGEMLMTIVIIGVISAITIPIISQTINDNIKPLYKSAFMNVETVVNELINDVSIYPSGEFANNTFCSNFFAKVNTIGAVQCTESFVSSPPDFPNAVTTNGMKWYYMDDRFDDSCPDGETGQCLKIQVDVNGSSGANTTLGDDKDILDIYIFQSGKVTVESGSTEETHLLD